ncbi:Rossmann-like and DUF2520 domain-containing protein [Rickettsiella endosymbiont of Aleochara curtula]|uniref:Rossmann-like and DUF2520 domain-containing protein n=1 Tax=Rickettsiella endosymbiont of Aleochara curtula TaxID=3077936 RepID=UPI00313B7F83
MKKLKLNVIGCGRLGKTLAALFLGTELVCIQDIVNLSMASGEKTVAFLGEGSVCKSLKQLRSADIYLIATPDDSIELIAQQITLLGILKPGNVVFHCSGLLSSESLSSVVRLGCYAASLHPIFSFSEPMMDVKTFRGTYCAFEGNKEALDRLLPLFNAIEGQIFLIEKKDKPLYHAASVLASNYLVTLSAMARDCYSKAGLNDELAENLTLALMSQALGKAQRLHPEKALTGPLQRADIGTLKKHLSALQPFPELEYIYKSLGKATLSLTRHNESLKRSLTQLFTS